MLALSLLLWQLHGQTSGPTIRAETPNGITVLSRRIPGAAQVSVQLVLASEGLRDLPTTNGRRHLLEHLWVKGRSEGWPAALERHGIRLLAHTFRDCIRVELTAGPRDWVECLRAVSELLEDREFTDADVAREMPILRQELALREDARRASAAAWGLAFGDAGLDPDGDLEVMQATTGAALTQLWRAQRDPRRVTVVIAGDLDAKEAIETARDVLPRYAPPSDDLPRDRRPEPKGGVAAASNLRGGAIAAPVEAFDAPETLATLAAALALASRFEVASLHYAPSWDRGLITLYHPRAGAIQEAIAAAKGGDELFRVGRDLLLVWVRSVMSDPGQCAGLLGAVSTRGRALDLDALLSAASNLSLTQFRDGLARFRAPQAVEVRP